MSAHYKTSPVSEKAIARISGFFAANFLAGLKIEQTSRAVAAYGVRIAIPARSGIFTKEVARPALTHFRGEALQSVLLAYSNELLVLSGICPIESLPPRANLAANL
ncbi:MAG: hypothetical protein SFX18_06185 [Pirellulales bacterium]|nr:hypothetical protein [Pirellulales bacterium]